MSTPEQVIAARKRLEQKWDSQGCCRSCGWHASLYEHDFADTDIQRALEGDGRLELTCVNKGMDPEEREGHRGVCVFIGTEDAPVCSTCKSTRRLDICPVCLL